MITAGATLRRNWRRGRFYGSYIESPAARNRKIFIIAEAGVNHNGSLALAKKMVDAAISAGADAVKFQTFKGENLATASAPKADYQKKKAAKGQSQLAMLKRLSLNADAHKQLAGYCRKKGITFLSSPFDLESVELLNSIGLEIFKIPSGEITNLPYLRKIGGLRKKIMLSTGMSDLEEIKTAVSILIDCGVAKNDITVLHCNTGYPTPPEDANLLAMLTIRDVLKVNVGYSDHTLGTEVAIAAGALGASVIEKHFTLDKGMKGPDHKASVEPDELKAMIGAIRNVEKALGAGTKKMSASESKNKTIVRKSLVASRFIKKGEFFGIGNIAAKRPARGISPMEWDKVCGSLAKKDFKKDEFIRL